jgi:excisionase family DNA binding protein
MSSLNIQNPIILSTEQVIVNHISIQVAAEMFGYNAQYMRRLLRAGKLKGVKIGQVWLIDLASLKTYFFGAINSDDLRCGPKGAWRPSF